MFFLFNISKLPTWYIHSFRRRQSTLAHGTELVPLGKPSIGLHWSPYPNEAAAAACQNIQNSAIKFISMASHTAPVFQPICLGRCRSSWLSSASVKPRQPVKDSCTTLRKLSAARALRSRSKTLESNEWRFATKPNHDASAKCAANAWFLSFPPWNNAFFLKQAQCSNKAKPTRHKFICRAAQPYNLDLPMVRSQRVPLPAGNVELPFTC